MLDAIGPLPAPTWTDPADLTRIGFEALIAHEEGDARGLHSEGSLRLHGAGVSGHSADLEDVGAITSAWQRAVTAVGAALEGVKTARGRVPEGIAHRTRLALVAAPGAGSLVLSLQPTSNPLEEVEQGGDRVMADPPRPLADQACEALLGLVGQTSAVELRNAEDLAGEFQKLGPRVATSVQALASAIVAADVSLDADWREPGAPTLRASWSAADAQWVREFIDGRELDTEESTLTGIAVTISNRERWLIETPDGDERVLVADLSNEDILRARLGESISILVRATTKVQPDGTAHTTKRAQQVLSVGGARLPSE